MRIENPHRKCLYIYIFTGIQLTNLKSLKCSFYWSPVYEWSCAVPEGVGAGPYPLEYYKNTGFLSNTGPDPLKITKLTIQHSILGHL